MVFQDNLNVIVSGVQALSLLSKIVKDQDGKQAVETAEISSLLRQLSSALVTSGKNDLDTPAFAPNPAPLPNNINGTEYFSTDGNDVDSDTPMSTDTESCDSDSQSEPDIDYQEELLSRMQYYGQYENSIPETPVQKPKITRTSSSTPLASSTILEESPVKNSRRHKKRSEPCASSTMMEDLLEEIQNQVDSEDNSIVTWSINSTDTASLKGYYNRYFGINDNSADTDSEPTTGFWMHTNANMTSIFNSDDSSTSSESDLFPFDFNGNGTLHRTSTRSDLHAATDTKKDKKKSKGKISGTKLAFLIRSIKRNFTKKSSSAK